VFFPIDAAEWKKALGQVRRLRSRGNLERISSSDSYWTSAFFAALVESVDYLLLEDPQQALELSRQGILLAGRIRAEDCPGGDEVGKRSLAAWAQAVHGSACRVLERYTDAEAAFQQASWLATSKPVLPWAAGEVWRRYAALCFSQGSLSCFDHLERALPTFVGYPAAQADTFLLLGTCHQYLHNDLSAAARETGKALEILEPQRSQRERRIWMNTIHNLSVISAKSDGDLTTVSATLKQLRRAAARLASHDVFRRMLFVTVEALLLARLGSGRQAERLLSKTCRWFFKHRYFHRGALASLDLALLYLRDGDKTAALAVVDQIAEDLAPAPPETKAYLSKWFGTWSATGPAELKAEELTELRDGLSLAVTRHNEKPQPLEMIDIPASSSSPESEEDPGSPAASGVASTPD